MIRRVPVALLLKVGAFSMACVLAAVLVVNTLSNPLAGETIGYRAVFGNAQGLRPGSDVRIAGVRVGAIDDVVLEQGHAVVSFDVLAGHKPPADVLAVINYADLLGSRYLALEAGQQATPPLPAGATIPPERTRPALDLTSLFNGFKPLFEAIDPSAVNELARQIVGTLQGEGDTLGGLLARVASLTSTLNSRKAVIGEVITNLNSTLRTVNAHRADIESLVNGLGELASTAADSRRQIAAALDSGAALADSLASVLDDLGPGLARDVRSLSELTGTMTRNQQAIEEVLGQAPAFLTTVNRTLDYGSWVNVYVCNLSVRIAGDPLDLGLGPHTEVCQ